MSRFIRRHRSQFGRVSVVFLTIIALVTVHMFALFFVGSADAAALTNRSDTISTSLHSATNVSHVFVFTTPSTWSHDDGGMDDLDIQISFPLNAAGDPYGVNNLAPGDVSVTCTSCETIVPTVSTVVESDAGGEAMVDDRYLITIDFGTNDADSTLNANVVWTVTLGTGATGVDNPADNPGGAAECTDGATASDADVCSIALDIDDSPGGGSNSDSGDVLVAHIDDVTVSVTVEESLAFSITAQNEGDCETTGTGPYRNLLTPDYAATTSSTVPFGNISVPGVFHHGCQLLQIDTNAANGYNVTVEMPTSLQAPGSIEIDSGVCDGTCTFVAEDTWTTVTQYGFGYSCDTDNGTSVCNFTTETTEYKRFPCTGAAADCVPSDGDAIQTVMTDTGAVADDRAMIEYLLNINPTQAAAVYTAQVVWIATPIF